MRAHRDGVSASLHERQRAAKAVRWLNESKEWSALIAQVLLTD